MGVALSRQIAAEVTENVEKGVGLSVLENAKVTNYSPFKFAC